VHQGKANQGKGSKQKNHMAHPVRPAVRPDKGNTGPAKPHQEKHQVFFTKIKSQKFFPAIKGKVSHTDNLGQKKQAKSIDVSPNREGIMSDQRKRKQWLKPT
jgi:hypothetical protein